MSGMFSGATTNAQKHFRGAYRPDEILNDKSVRRASLDPFDLTKPPETPTPPPPPPEPTPMPIPDDAAVTKKRQQDYARQRQRSGRMSTILSAGTSNSEPLG